MRVITFFLAAHAVGHAVANAAIDAIADGMKKQVKNESRRSLGTKGKKNLFCKNYSIRIFRASKNYFLDAHMKWPILLTLVVIRERQFISAPIKIICPRRSRGLMIILPARQSRAKVKYFAHERSECRQGIYWHE